MKKQMLALLTVTLMSIIAVVAQDALPQRQTVEERTKLPWRNLQYCP